MATQRRPAPQAAPQPARPAAPAVKSKPTAIVPKPSSAPRPGTGATAGKPAAPAPARKETTRRTAKPATTRSSGSTRVVQRGAPAPGSKKDNKMLLYLGIGGAVLLILVVALVMSGKKENGGKKGGEDKKAEQQKEPVDVSGLERDGTAKCEEGLAIIKSCQAFMDKPEPSEAEKADACPKLQNAVELIKKGMSYLTMANEKSGHTYNTSGYSEAMKLAKDKLRQTK